MGQDNISVIGASVCLDPGCMQLAQTLRVQSKSTIISVEVMKDIFRVREWMLPTRKFTLQQTLK